MTEQLYAKLGSSGPEADADGVSSGGSDGTD
jgi:hypothetical protein